MSREQAIRLTGVDVDKLLEEDEDLQEFYHRQVQVLDRTSKSRYDIEAPDNIHYEWHPDDPESHQRLTEQGFIRNDELAKTSTYAHTDGSGRPTNYGTYLYTIPKNKYQILQKIKNERAERQANPERPEAEFHETIRNSGIQGLKGIQHPSASNTSRSVSNDEIKTILTQDT